MVIARKKDSLFARYKKHKALFLLLVPIIIYFAVFHYGPIYGLIIAFKDYYPIDGIWGSQWIGLENFKQLFSGIYFLPVLRNTLLISLYKLVFGFPVPIIFCLLLNEVKNRFFKKGVQTISYLPHFISWVILAGIVKEVLSPSRGIINYFLQLLGQDPIFFIADESWFRTVLVSSDILKEMGWQAVIYLAAVSGIDPELYDVANIDGAGRIRRIFSITIPCIMPTIIIMLIFATGRIMADNFDQVYNLINAKVYSVGDVISTYTFREGIKNLNYGYATAVGLFKNAISFILVVSTNAFARKMSGNSIW